MVTVALVLALFWTAVAQENSSADAAKSHGAAMRLSLFGTLGPMLIGAALTPGSEGNIEEIAVFTLAGMAFGPGLGHAYAGNSRRFLLGAGIRAVALAGAVGATASSYDTGDATAFAYGGGVALAVYLASAVYDIATTGKSVDKYNDKHGLTHVTLSTTYLADQDTPGLVVAWHL